MIEKTDLKVCINQDQSFCFIRHSIIFTDRIESNDWMIMYDKWGRTWMEMVAVYFK
jgi:hypothetical protein